jgi:centromere-localized protein 2
MVQACTDVEAEIAAMEVEAEMIINQVRSTVGDLSDLRYGPLPRASGTSKTTVDEALEGMKRLQDICNGRVQA